MPWAFLCADDQDGIIPRTPGKTGMSMSTQTLNSQMAVLLFTDLVGSVRLKTEMGVSAYATSLSRHDQIVRSAISGFTGARIVKDIGDGVFASFARVSDAVNAALMMQAIIASELWGQKPFVFASGSDWRGCIRWRRAGRITQGRWTHGRPHRPADEPGVGRADPAFPRGI